MIKSPNSSFPQTPASSRHFCLGAELVVHCDYMVAPKCQSSYTEARNSTIRCVAAGSTFATQRIVVLSTCEVSTQQFPHRTPRHNQLLCHGVLCRNIVVLSYLTHNTTICCVVADNSKRNKLLCRQNMKPIRNGS